MGKVKGLHDPPAIFRKTKTTIDKGQIVRTSVWVDSLGNELEKRGDKFYMKRMNEPFFNFLQNQQQPIIQFEPRYDQKDKGFHDSDMAIVLLVGISFLSGLFIGYLCGILRKKAIVNQQIKDQIELDKIQLDKMNLKRVNEPHLNKLNEPHLTNINKPKVMAKKVSRRKVK